MSMASERSWISGRDRPNSFKQVVTDPLPNAWQQVYVSQLLRDDHYKGFARVTVSVERQLSLTAQ